MNEVTIPTEMINHKYCFLLQDKHHNNKLLKKKEEKLMQEQNMKMFLIQWNLVTG